MLSWTKCRKLLTIRLHSSIVSTCYHIVQDKTTVAGKHANRLYAQLAKVTGTEPQWNFHKYLIDRTGQKVLSFGGRVKPEDRALLASSEELLGK